MIATNPPDYKDLSPVQFCAGFTGIILSQLPLSLAGSPTAHQLMHLNRLLTYAMDSPWNACLNFNAAFFRSIEQRQSSWDNWEKIQSWHSRHLESLKLCSSSKGINPSANGRQQTNEKAEDSANGVPFSFMKQSKLCIKFQSEICDQESGHFNGFGKTALSHNCAYCLLKLKTVAVHSAKSCPERAKVFTKGGGRGASST